MSTLDQKKPGLRERLRARPALYGSIAVAAIALIVVVLVVFQPQRLLYDNVVDDEFPVVESTSDDAMATDDDPAAPEDAAEDPAGGDDGRSDDDDGTAAETDDALLDDEDDGAQSDDTEAEAEPEPTGPVALSSGDFISRSRYTVTGEATVYELEDGSRTLRLEDFESTNGPNLFVYLTSADADAPDADLDADYIDLGALRGNVGNQNYDIPADVDLEVYDTVVIWCRPFSVAFGAADLA
jgi:hypothetical protein